MEVNPQMTATQRQGPLAGMRVLDLSHVMGRVGRLRATAEWLALLEKAGVPAGPVLSVQEMHAHPQTQACNMVQVVEHATAGKVQTLGLPIKFSDTPGAINRAAPVYGAQSREILKQAGYSPSEIDDLIAESVVAEPARLPGVQNA